MQRHQDFHSKDLNHINSLRVWPHSPHFNPFLWLLQPGSNPSGPELLRAASTFLLPPMSAPCPWAPCCSACYLPQPVPTSSIFLSPKQGHGGFLRNILVEAPDGYVGTKQSSSWAPINCTHAMTFSYVKITQQQKKKNLAVLLAPTFGVLLSALCPSHI